MSLTLWSMKLLERKGMLLISEKEDAIYVVKDGKIVKVDCKQMSDADCFAKAIIRNQPTFTLVGQDACAIETMVKWKELVKEQNPDSPKLKQVDLDITRFIEWQDTNQDKLKIPD